MLFISFTRRVRRLSMIITSFHYLMSLFSFCIPNRESSIRTLNNYRARVGFSCTVDVLSSTYEYKLAQPDNTQLSLLFHFRYPSSVKAAFEPHALATFSTRWIHKRQLYVFTSSLLADCDVNFVKVRGDAVHPNSLPLIYLPFFLPCVLQITPPIPPGVLVEVSTQKAGNIRIAHTFMYSYTRVILHSSHNEDLRGDGRETSVGNET
jgi:hypothetical protein